MCTHNSQQHKKNNKVDEKNPYIEKLMYGKFFIAFFAHSYVGGRCCCCCCLMPLLKSVIKNLSSYSIFYSSFSRCGRFDNNNKNNDAKVSISNNIKKERTNGTIRVVDELCSFMMLPMTKVFFFALSTLCASFIRQWVQRFLVHCWRMGGFIRNGFRDRNKKSHR
jgi:hypothetical protein